MESTKQKPKLRRFSKLDVDIILEEVDNSPMNLQNAFSNASNRIGRSIYAVQNKFYSSLRDKTKNSMVGLKSNTASKGSKTIARVNGIMPDISDKVSSVKTLLIAYLELNKSEQKSFETIIKLLK